mmetsp:Transcript_13130/g.19880  ORF Transcript_13130/g.19880 Transcript_13130/m.19880 type:complete len:165 (-) Transcript_13130:95-589(-)
MTISNDNNTMMNMISSDGREFEVPAEVAMLCKTFANIMEEENDEDITENDLICQRVSGDILEKVIDFCTHHVTIEPMVEIRTPFKSDTSTLEEIVTQEWYCKFCENITREETFQLIKAANFLDIQPLLALSVLAMCVDINNKSVKDLQSIFKITPPAKEQGVSS